jgi:hypothetical protein
MNAREILRQFWGEHPSLSRRKVNGDYTADTRIAFTDYIDHLSRSGQITEAQAQRVTLL